LWRIASAAWLLDESDVAITLLQDAMRRLRAPGVQGTSGGSLTVLAPYWLPYWLPAEWTKIAMCL
jgi:hypothetical protein